MKPNAMPRLDAPRKRRVFRAFFHEGLARSFIVLGPALVALVVLFILPLAAVLSLSFTDPELGLQNFRSIWQSRGFRNILFNTFEISATSTVVCLIIGFPVAYHMSTLRKRWAHPLLALIMVPFATSLLARLYAWTLLLGDAGIINGTLMRVGLISSPIPLLFERAGVIIGTVYMLLPYMILVLYVTMARVDGGLLEAASTLGAKPVDRFLRVFLPLTAPGIYAGLLIIFILSLGYYFTPALLGGRDVTVSTFVAQAIQVMNWGMAAAMSVILLIVTVALFLLFDGLFPIERLIVGGSRR